MALAISSVLVLLLLIAGILAVNGLVQKSIEDRKEVESTYLSVLKDWKLSTSNYTKQLAAASNLLRTVKSDDLNEESDLDDLKAAVAAAEGVEYESEIAPLELKASKNHEIEERIALLRKSQASIDETTKELERSFNVVGQKMAQKRLDDEKARLAAEAKAKKAAAKAISFEELFRAGSSLTGNYFKFEGRIVQVNGDGAYRVSVTRVPGYSKDFWEDPLLLAIVGEPSQKLLEDDLIGFVGKSMGTFTYKSIFNQSIEVPLIAADAADVSVNGRY